MRAVFIMDQTYSSRGVPFSKSPFNGYDRDLDF